MNQFNSDWHWVLESKGHKQGLVHRGPQQTVKNGLWNESVTTVHSSTVQENHKTNPKLRHEYPGQREGYKTT